MIVLILYPNFIRVLIRLYVEILLIQSLLLRQEKVVKPVVLRIGK
jgi:hypothetical protein